jgi:hypothetical protein
MNSTEHLRRRIANRNDDEILVLVQRAVRESGYDSDLIAMMVSVGWGEELLQLPPTDQERGDDAS